MNNIARAQCIAVSAQVPEKRLRNQDLEQMVDTSDEWITTRTGIKERRIVETGNGLSTLAIPAAQQCLAKAGVLPEELDGIIVATITADHSVPACANLVQKGIGASKAFAYDIGNACNGFISALSNATAFIESGHCQNILVLGGDIMSSIVNYQDRNTCILFGDGCGAILLQAGAADGSGVVDFIMQSDGEGAEFLSIPCSGSASPINADKMERGEHFVHQDGKNVFPHAVRRMAEVAEQLMERLSLSADDIDIVVPHQANLRIIESTARRMGIGMDKVIINIDKVANTTAGTIPLALADAEERGLLNDGTRVFLVAFGGGFSWGASYLTWGR